MIQFFKKNVFCNAVVEMLGVLSQGPYIACKLYISSFLKNLYVK